MKSHVRQSWAVVAVLSGASPGCNEGTHSDGDVAVAAATAEVVAASLNENGERLFVHLSSPVHIDPALNDQFRLSASLRDQTDEGLLFSIADLFFVECRSWGGDACSYDLEPVRLRVVGAGLTDRLEFRIEPFPVPESAGIVCGRPDATLGLCDRGQGDECAVEIGLHVAAMGADEYLARGQVDLDWVNALVTLAPFHLGWEFHEDELPSPRPEPDVLVQCH